MFTYLSSLQKETKNFYFPSGLSSKVLEIQKCYVLPTALKLELKTWATSLRLLPSFPHP